MTTLTITLNGATTQAKPGETILDVAKRNAIFIPTLCHEKRLEPFGSCRVCLVKVEGAKAFVPSCSTKVSQGMVISTESPEIVEARYLCLSLLISEHYGDCVSPCSLQCPAHIDIQGYIALINAGNYGAALKLIKERNPLPLSIGRVCPHPCETACRRKGVEDPIAINNLKRFVADYDAFGIKGDHTPGAGGLETGALLRPFIPEMKEKNGKKIAVVGSGPAGLSAAYYLAKEGYGVTVFEKHPKAGGMLRYGIPEYRLPKLVLDREIELIQAMGVDIRYNRELGKEFTLGDLKKEGYDAAFLGVGAWKSIGLRIEGENLSAVMSGIDFLYDVASGKQFDFAGKTVMVVGGGNTAMDAARTSVRLGAWKVTILYRRTKEEMPANEIEIIEAEEEGIVFEYLAAPIRVAESRGGGALDVECIRMELGKPDESGRRRPIPIEGSDYTLSVDVLITAVGQAPDISCLADEDRSLVTQRQTLKASRESGATADGFVYAGGDCVTGAATAIEAVAAGRLGAESIDLFLKTGIKRERPPFEFNIAKGSVEEMAEEFFGSYKKLSRVVMPALEPARRVKGFEEIEQGLLESQAIAESARCLECGCAEGFSCSLRDNSTRFGVQIEDFKAEKQVPRDWRNDLLKHPNIVREESKCIRCGICVRICDEVWGLHVYGFVNRGSDTQVAPSFGLPLRETECDFCGQCADACPTGALSLGAYLPKPGPFKVEKREGICLHCSLGCSLEYNIYENVLVKVTSSPGMGENEGNLCVRGRFGYGYLLPSRRALEYLELASGTRRPIGREQAVERSLAILKRAKRPAVVFSTQLSDEEIELANDLAAKLGTARAYHVAHDLAEDLNGGPSIAGKSALLGGKIDGIPAPSLGDIGKSGVILLYNIRPGRHYPILEMHVRRAAQKGARLYVVNESPIRLDGHADGVFRVKGDASLKLMEMIGGAIGQGTATGKTERGAADDWAVHGSSLPGVFGVKPQKFIQLIRDLAEKGPVALISDQDLCNVHELRAFAEIANRLKGRASLLLMQKGMNAGGASRGNPAGVSFLGSDTLASHDAFLFFGTPELDTGGKPFVQIGFTPFTSRGPGGGVFVPSSSLLETGGNTRIYNGNRVRVSPIIKSERNLDNQDYLRALIAGVSASGLSLSAESHGT